MPATKDAVIEPQKCPGSSAQGRCSTKLGHGPQITCICAIYVYFFLDFLFLGIWVYEYLISTCWAPRVRSTALGRGATDDCSQVERGWNSASWITWVPPGGKGSDSLSVQQGDLGAERGPHASISVRRAARTHAFGHKWRRACQAERTSRAGMEMFVSVGVGGSGLLCLSQKT